MSPFVRGRFIPEIERAGNVKACLDVLLWLPQTSQSELKALDSIEILRNYLSSIKPAKCHINLWVPETFTDAHNALASIGIEFGTIGKANPNTKVQTVFGAGTPQEVLEIAATGLSVDADVIVTSNQDWYPYVFEFEKLDTLLADCQILKRHAGIFARGHDLPFSLEFPVWNRPWNGFYQTSEQRTFQVGIEFLNRASGKNLAKDTQEAGRSLVHNRLPNLCFTRDRLLFYDMQQTASRRLGWERQEFLFEAGYYLNFYYLLIHGGFDHLALVVNGGLNLGLAPKNVGATYAGFLTALQLRAPEIYALFTDPKLLEFVARVSSLRHFAAHRGSIAPSKIYEELDPKPTDAELDAEIAHEHLDDFLAVVPNGPVRDAFRATLRQKMLLSKSKLIAEGIVFVELNGRWNYIRPMSDIEWNFERFHAFMVAVLNGLIARI